MANASAPRMLRFAAREFELGGPHLGELRDCNQLLDQPEQLRARFAEDGYLLVRGLHDPDAVRAARADFLDGLAVVGALDPAQPRALGAIGAVSGNLRVGDMSRNRSFLDVVEGERVMGFFARFLGGAPLTFDYKWLRAVTHEEFTGAHLDIVYMGRGTPALCTCWTPFGDTTYEQGPLAICVGSHRLPGFARMRETYGRMDVERDRIEGWFSTDPLEVVERFGGRWATTEFRAGDALIFGMFTLHASLTNVSPCFRISSDTRYQLRSDPVDERWIGSVPTDRRPPSDPATHERIAAARARWGV